MFPQNNFLLVAPHWMGTHRLAPPDSNDHNDDQDDQGAKIGV
jgi:hypothetical protein